MSVIIETTVGDIIVDLYPEERANSCYNFLKLCKLKYYNFCRFHCIQENFVAQTGDPTGTGEGGSSVTGLLEDGGNPEYFDMEIVPKIRHTKAGLISMVNNGLGQHGSQFLFTLAPSLDSLDGQHTVFGEVAEAAGFSVLEKLSAAYCDEQGKPFQDILITHTIILEDPYPDPPSFNVPSRSPSPRLTRRGEFTIAADEELDEFRGLNEVEINERINSKTTKTNLKLLEVIGDIHDSDELPPENVLFICKLHPSTNSEDLAVIFAKFGNVVSTEIIRDQKTGDSLCYGFVEFDNIDDCSNAYFKMDNVLIDDRRIHVDFCQSLANKASSQRKGGNSFEENNAIKQEYGLVFDNMELLQQAMRKKAKETRSRNKNPVSERDERERRNRMDKKSPPRSPPRIHKSKRRHSPDYRRDNRQYKRDHHSPQREYDSYKLHAHHRSRSDHKHKKS
ncbi:Peptidyl-prolyl cis-trans isomerase-like 4 [Oopsacas minuta]|uniref:Peptidyl-prolyl cis-trans isomerase n=1 Tax=Oopsacas minuta TaxID=111878 RepID=A0AAV7JI96_9METZ|nr:Peptidyl-prolyl cis-trans isomerase-like 4 [Oopsacas minuta]